MRLFQLRFILLLTCLVVTFSEHVYSKNFYINNKTGSDINDGTINSPWETTDLIGWMEFLPGDAIYFARGCKWDGGFPINSSGTLQQPLLISAYGKGKAPIFTNPNNKDFNGNCIRVNGDYIIIEKLHFDATADARGEVNIFDIGAVYIKEGADYVTIQDCEFTDCPKALNIFGEHSKITRNTLINKGRSLRDKYWGPIAICIQSSYHEISYNLIRDYIGKSEAYNWDGGVIEIDIRTKSADGLLIHHNTSIGNCGFIENEYWELGGQGQDWIIAYNVISDYQWFIDVGPGGNSIIAHNTIAIRDIDPPCPYYFIMDNLSFRRTGLYVNNIFLSYSGLILEGIAADIRKHNIIFSVDGKTEHPGGPNMGLGDREIDPGLVDIKNNNFRLTQNSPAIDMGTNVGLTHELFRIDNAGNIVPEGTLRDIGAYEFVE